MLLWNFSEGISQHPGCQVCIDKIPNELQVTSSKLFVTLMHQDLTSRDNTTIFPISLAPLHKCFHEDVLQDLAGGTILDTKPDIKLPHF